jgi:AraC-like DNA-binding protein
MSVRAPRVELRPFVKTLWASSAGAATAERELVLPSGTMHVVFRLGTPLRLFEDVDDHVGRTLGAAVVGGARARYYVKDVTRPAASVGVELRPGAAERLLGVPAGVLAERHTSLVDVVGSVADETLARLHEARSRDARLDVMEAFLMSRLSHGRVLHPAVAAALTWLDGHDDVAEAVRRSGYSHRRFGDLFRSAVGLGPKVYGRVRRWYGVLGAAGREGRSWAEVALDAGYSDQPHLHRDFREFAGMPPGRYRALCPGGSRHVPVSIPSKTGARAGAKLWP